MTTRLRPNRFCAVGGSLMADVTHEWSLEEAAAKLCEWWTEARYYQRQGDFRRAAQVRRDADDLQAAKLKVEQWRRSAGWERPEDVDAQRSLYLASLAESVLGERADV